MKKILLVLVLVLSLVSIISAQTTYSYERTNLEPGPLGEATTGNSQFIYIRVTMIGVHFSVTDGDWVIGVAPTWYATAGNTYHNVNGATYAGVFPPSYETEGIYATHFTRSVPNIWNKGGVALDFMLSISTTGGWLYDSKHSSNRLANEHVTSNRAFENAMQVRAIFLNNVFAATTHDYDDTRYIADGGGFKFNTHTMDPWTPAVIDHINVGDAAGLKDCDVIYTDALDGSGHLLGGDFSASAGTDWWGSVSSLTNPSWFEASSNRFDPRTGVLGYTQERGIIGATALGVGLAPDMHSLLAMELLTPHTVTRSHRALLEQQQIIKVQLWGTISDATGN
jgi:hypothetical protein